MAQPNCPTVFIGLSRRGPNRKYRRLMGCKVFAEDTQQTCCSSKTSTDARQVMAVGGGEQTLFTMTGSGQAEPVGSCHGMKQNSREFIQRQVCGERGSEGHFWLLCGLPRKMAESLGTEPGCCIASETLCSICSCASRCRNRQISP